MSSSWKCPENSRDLLGYCEWCYLINENVFHYDDVITGAIASQITSLTIVYSTDYSGAYQSKHQSSTSLAFVWGIHRGPVNSPHKWPITRKMSPFDDVIMEISNSRVNLRKNVFLVSIEVPEHPRTQPWPGSRRLHHAGRSRDGLTYWGLIKQARATNGNIQHSFLAEDVAWF